MMRVGKLDIFSFFIEQTRCYKKIEFENDSKNTIQNLYVLT